MWESLRKRMVKEQLQARGIKSPLVLDSFSRLPREIFVPLSEQIYAYDDCPLPIGWNQTISQPFIVALMTEHLHCKQGGKVLEIGTGSGYQCALLATMGYRVYSMERIPQLARNACKALKSLGLDTRIKVGDGTLGWEEESPFDGVIVTAAAFDIPDLLLSQLTIGGRLIIPLGDRESQELVLVNKVSETEYKKELLGKCAFVPLIGKYAWHGY